MIRVKLKPKTDSCRHVPAPVGIHRNVFIAIIPYRFMLLSDLVREIYDERIHIKGLCLIHSAVTLPKPFPGKPVVIFFVDSIPFVSLCGFSRPCLPKAQADISPRKNIPRTAYSRREQNDRGEGVWNFDKPRSEPPVLVPLVGICSLSSCAPSFQEMESPTIPGRFTLYSPKNPGQPPGSQSPAENAPARSGDDVG
jgi:hypothetical protein